MPDPRTPYEAPGAQTLGAPPAGIESRAGLLVWVPNSATRTGTVNLWVTTRRGGTSAPPFDGLNLSPSTGDDREAVEANRTRLRHATGVETWHWLHQVHGNVVVHSSALQGIPGGTLQADGLWTDEPQVALAIGVADCVPVFLWDSRAPRLAVVHAGWRGTVEGVLASALVELTRAGSNSRDLHVALGPSIGPCCYEVGSEVTDRLPAEAVHQRGGGAYADLRAALRHQAILGGIPPTQVQAETPCTACHPTWFYSHRRLGPRTGRMWAVGWLQPSR